jgi:mRNA interferase MazF
MQNKKEQQNKEKEGIIKRFLERIGLKEKLHQKTSKVPFVSEGDIWWVGFGENIGSEINGKSEKFSRPGIIYKKLSNNFYLVIPTTTKEKIGSWFVSFIHKGVGMNACLHQVRTIDYRRLFSRLGSLSLDDFNKVKSGFNGLYK